MRYIEKVLKDHKEKKAQLEIIEARIEAYRIALVNPSVRSNVYYVSPWNIGMPRVESTGSSVEKSVMSDEKICEALRTLINDEESRILHLRLEVKEIEKALSVLSAEARYVIECRYFSDLNWQSTEINYNREFKGNEMTMHGLRKIKDSALDKLDYILSIRSLKS